MWAVATINNHSTTAIVSFNHSMCRWWWLRRSSERPETQQGVLDFMHDLTVLTVLALYSIMLPVHIDQYIEGFVLVQIREHSRLGWCHEDTLHKLILLASPYHLDTTTSGHTRESNALRTSTFVSGVPPNIEEIPLAIALILLAWNSFLTSLKFDTPLHRQLLYSIYLEALSLALKSLRLLLWDLLC